MTSTRQVLHQTIILPHRMSLLPLVSSCWRHTCFRTERLLKARDKQSRTRGNLTCRHSSRLFKWSSSGVCWSITDSLTCLFKASPPKTPVTSIPKPEALSLCLSALCRWRWLFLSVLAKPDLCFNALEKISAISTYRTMTFLQSEYFWTKSVAPIFSPKIQNF